MRSPVGWTPCLRRRGSRLGRAQKSYGEAMGKLTTGSGNVFRLFEMLKSLVAKASETLPAGLLDSEPSLTHPPHPYTNKQ